MTYCRSVWICVGVRFVCVVTLTVHEGLLDLFTMLTTDGFKLFLLLFFFLVLTFATGVKEVRRQLFLFDTIL